MPPDPVRRFDARELRRFLAAVDAGLAEPVRAILVGGSALAIGYEVGGGTVDVDTWETDLGSLAGAIARARTTTGLDIPVDSAAVGDMPYEYQSRLRRVLPRLHRLEVYVPEKHDLALSKIMRCHEGDLAGLEALHRLHALDEETLAARYMEEMSHAIGDPRRIDLNLLAAIERLFGTLEAEAVERRLSAWRRRQATSSDLPRGRTRKTGAVGSRSPAREEGTPKRRVRRRATRDGRARGPGLTA